MIENIWAGQSAVSGEKDLFELILVRWNITEHWSPWNCILLTTDEARAHVKLDDPEKVDINNYYYVLNFSCYCFIPCFLVHLTHVNLILLDYFLYRLTVHSLQIR